MPRVNQIVGCFIQVAAIASIPSCMSLVPQFIDISAPTFYIGPNAPAEYKSLINKFERVRSMSQFPGIADHTGLGALKAIIKENAVREIEGRPKLPLPKESKLTGGADYCFVRDTFRGGERSVSCYAVAEGKIEVRLFDEYSCRKFPKTGCGVGATTDQRFTSDYQEGYQSTVICGKYQRKICPRADSDSFYISYLALVRGWITKQNKHS